MAMKFLNGIDLGTNELQNAVVHNLPTASLPAGVDGQIVYDSTVDLLKFFNGTAWVTLSAASASVQSITAGNAISITGTSTDPVVNHADTSTQSSVDNSGNTFIQDVTLDTYGHVTGLASAAVDGYSGWTVSDGTNSENVAEADTVQFTGTGAASVSYDTVSNTMTIDATNTTYTAGNGITLSSTEFSVAAGTGLTQETGGLAHADTSTQGSVDNSGNTFIQDVTLDGFGHVTGLTSVAVSSLDNYQSWTIAGDTGSEAIASGNTLTIAGGANVTTTYTAASNTLTIASTDNNDIDYISGASFIGGTLNLTGVGNAGASVSLDGRYLQSYTETQTLDDVTGLGNSTANSITVGGLIVNGDLTVSGVHTVKLAEEVQLEDSLMVLNVNEAGTPSEDAGFVVERGTEANVAFIWDESADQFAFISTTETGTTAGDVTISSYANIKGSAADFANLSLSAIVNAGADTDKFLVLDGSGNVDFRTGAEVLSDIGGQAAITAGDYIAAFSIAGNSGTANEIVDGETLSILGGGDVTTSATDNTITVSFTESYTAHENISAATSANNSGITFIQDVTVDGNGHVTGLASVAVRAASTTQTGVVELATVTEASTGTATGLAVTPAGLDRYNTDREAVFTLSGDGTTTAFGLTHNFGTRTVMCEIIDFGDNGTGATYETVYADVERNSDNQITVTFGAAPSATQDYKAMLRVIA